MATQSCVAFNSTCTPKCWSISVFNSTQSTRAKSRGKWARDTTPASGCCVTLLVPGGERTSQYLAIYGDPVVRRIQLHLHAKVLVNQRVQLHPVHTCQESR